MSSIRNTVALDCPIVLLYFFNDLDILWLQQDLYQNKKLCQTYKYLNPAPSISWVLMCKNRNTVALDCPITFYFSFQMPGIYFDFIRVSIKIYLFQSCKLTSITIFTTNCIYLNFVNHVHMLIHILIFKINCNNLYNY